MIKKIYYLILVIVSISCNSKQESKTESGSFVASNTKDGPAETIREEYWLIETETVNLDTAINSGDSFRIKINTRSLNDSAALYKATDEQGEILIHTHNRISDITILKNGTTYIKVTLTRDLFNGRDELDELRLNYGTTFLRQEENEFIFSVGACVPDSDICDAAEIAIDEKGVPRVKKYIEE